jgi:Family of unknown function (DUF5681)
MARKTPSQPPRRQHISGGAPKSPDHHEAAHQAGVSPEGHDMDSSTGGNQGTYEVGYGRPPLHSRFKPGQSGNPKGRAKQSRNMRTIVKQVLSEDMQIREAGRFRRMSAMEALVRTILARSFKGDPRALGSLLVLLRQSNLVESDETIADPLHAPEYDAIAADFLARNGVENAGGEDNVNSPTSPIETSRKREG